jgi:alcohol dehydrogenase class IV
VTILASPSVNLFRIPTRIVFGRGVAARAAEPLVELGVKRALIVTDRGVRGARLLEPVEQSVRDAGIAYEIYDEVVPDPGVAEVDRCFARYRASGAEAIVAVGGGSAIDTAKMAAVLATNGGSVLDYVGIDKVARPAAPVVAIPTTAGTGAELCVNSVIANKDEHKKLVIISPNATPLYALEDPLMTVGLPPFLTAITGMDTLVHAIESFVCKNAYRASEILALEAVKDAAEALPRAVKDGKDLEARDLMMQSVIMATLAFSNTRLGNVHAMALPLGGWFNVAHGTAVAVLLPHVMAFNRDAAGEKFAALARAMGEPAEAQRAVDHAFRLNEQIGIPPRLREVGVREDGIERMTDDAMKSGNIAVNPRATSREDIVALYRAAL